jgi:hypothetical protein
VNQNCEEGQTRYLWDYHEIHILESSALQCATISSDGHYLYTAFMPNVILQQEFQSGPRRFPKKDVLNGEEKKEDKTTTQQRIHRAS